MNIIRRISGCEFGVVTDLSPSVVEVSAAKAKMSKSTSKSSKSISIEGSESISGKSSSSSIITKEGSTSKTAINNESVGINEEATIGSSESGGISVSLGLSYGIGGSLGIGSSEIGSIRSSLTVGELLGRDDLLWFRFDTITRVIGVVTNHLSLDWNVSGTGLVLSGVGDGLLISVGSFVGDHWNFTGLNGDDWLVLDFINGVNASLLLNSVLGLVLNSSVLVEDGVVSGLSLLSVEHGVLVGVAGLWLISVMSDGVRSLKDLNLVSVSVLLFFSVKDLVMSLIGGEWDISVFGLDIVAVGNSWFPGVAEVLVVSVLDLESLGVSEFLLWPVFGLSVVASGANWDLSSSDFSFCLGLDAILDFIIEDLDVSESFFRTIRGVSVYNSVVIILNGDGVNGADKSSNVFHFF